MADGRRCAAALDRINAVLASSVPEPDLYESLTTRSHHRRHESAAAAAHEQAGERRHVSRRTKPTHDTNTNTNTKTGVISSDHHDDDLIASTPTSISTSTSSSLLVDLLPPSLRRSTRRARAAAWSGPLSLEGVTFAYPSRPQTVVLDTLSLTLTPGTTTALVGHSGSGKSTIGALLASLYVPRAGQITVAGHPTSAFPRQAWARAVALLTQDPQLFSGTVAENIAYGYYYHDDDDDADDDEEEEEGENQDPADDDNDGSDHRSSSSSTTTTTTTTRNTSSVVKEAQARDTVRARVEQCAKDANAHDFIMSLPEGYDTRVGPQGLNLSGGQRQRICIARALMKDAPILILDEPTSALDAQTERAVQGALDRLVQGRTVLVIAHRLATVQKADAIVVLREGVVMEKGSHADLLAAGGEYADLVGAQRLAFA